MSVRHLVVMGVAGCGKSAVVQAAALHLGLPAIEGDSFHPPHNVEKMRQGAPLTDEDRAGWLLLLCAELDRHPGGAVLACSALKVSYREVLRAGRPGLLFVQLALTQEQALERVAQRKGHYFSAGLVASQFEALQDPAGEPDVRVVDATLPLDEVVRQVVGRFNNP